MKSRAKVTAHARAMSRTSDKTAWAKLENSRATGARLFSSSLRAASAPVNQPVQIASHLRVESLERLVLGQRAVSIAHREIGHAEAHVRVGIFRLEPQGLLVGRDSLRESVRLVVGVAERVVCVGIVRADADRLLEAFDGLRVLSSHVICRAEIDERLRVIGLVLHGALEGFDGVRELAHVEVGLAQIVMGARVIRLQGERALERLDGLRVWLP